MDNQKQEAYNEYRHLICQAMFSFNLMDEVPYLDLFNGICQPEIKAKLCRTVNDIAGYIKIKYRLTNEDMLSLTRQIVENALYSYVIEHAFSPEPVEMSQEERAKMEREVRQVFEQTVAGAVKPDPSLQ